MKDSKNKIEVNIERIIPASVDEVFSGWLDPKIPGNPWNAADKFILDPKVDGLFYWLLKGTAHYGRFTQVERPHRIAHTWVSPNTAGLESMVSVTFKSQGADTLMVLVHSDLPATEEAKKHEPGWIYLVGVFGEQFGKGTRKKFNWEEMSGSDGDCRREQ